jgi:hypothetical protein
MKKIVIGVLCVVGIMISTQLSAQSQSRGYLGRKDLISYAPTASIYLSDLDFVLKHRIQYERVVSKRSSLLGVVGISNMKYEPSFYEFPVERDVEQQINMLELGFVYRYYKRINSPVGPFRQIGVGYMRSTVDVEEGSYTPTNPLDTWVSDSRSVALHSLNITYEFGSSRMISERVFIQYSLETTLNVPFSHKEPHYVDATPSEEDFNETLSYHTASYVRGLNFGLRIAFGFMP